MKKTIKLALYMTSILLISTLMQACRTTGPIGETELQGKWILHTLDGKESGSVFADKKPTIEFNFSDEEVHGTAGCNNYNAKFKIENGVITISDVKSTDMLCPAAQGEQEYLKLLTQPHEMFIQDDLLFFRRNGRIFIAYKAEHSQME